MQKEDNALEKYAFITFLVEQLNMCQCFDSDPSSILHWAMCKCGFGRKSAQAQRAHI